MTGKFSRGGAPGERDDSSGAGRRERRVRPPLDEIVLGEMALAYAARFATTRSRLVTYLDRKLRERGWSGEVPADPAALAERLSGLGYVSDGDYAIARARSLTRRGYGAGRVGRDLYAAGIDAIDGAAARDLAAAGAVDSALRFIERRRIGPFASETNVDPALRQRWLGALIRAGHPFALARILVSLQGVDQIDAAALARAVNRGDESV